MALKVKDIAKKLNLSSAAVSLALNNKPGVSEATREMVRNAVKEMGGEALIKGESDKQSFLFLVYHKNLSHNESPYFSQLFADIIKGAEIQAQALGYHMILTYADFYSLEEKISQVDRKSIKGILLLATDLTEKQAAYFTDLQLPVVVVDNYWDHISFDSVTIGNSRGVFQVVEHLVAMNHKKIGYVHIVRDANNFNERMTAFRHALHFFDICMEHKYIYEIETELGGEEVYRTLLKKLDVFEDIPTAIFADNDILAMYLIKALKEKGYRLPEDISVVGFDNMAMAEILEPALTTVHPDKNRMGEMAVKLLYERTKETKNIKTSIKIEVGTQLICRRSVANLP